MEPHKLLDILLSGGVVSTLVATGVYIQKFRTAETRIQILESRNEIFEATRRDVDSLKTKISSLDDKIESLKRDMRDSFTDMKEFVKLVFQAETTKKN